MRITKKTSKKPIIITAIIVVVVVCVGLLGFLWFNSRSTEKDNDSQQTNSSKESSTKKSNQGASSESSEDNSVYHEPEKDISPSYEGNDANTSQKLTGVINYKSVVNHNLSIRTTINQLLGSGDCELVLSNGSKTITRTGQIVQNPSSSSCSGFDIPVSELGSGTWSIRINIKSGDRTGTLNDTVDI